MAKAAVGIKNRISEYRLVPGDELHPNPRNWRTHGYAQKAAMAEVLAEIGVAGALIAYHSERNDGKLTLIDGHLRREELTSEPMPTLILDVNDDEADQLLATYDPIGELADSDGVKLSSLLEDVHFASPALEDLLHGLRSSISPEEEEAAREGADVKPALGPPEMELQPFEHYDYVVLLAKTSQDWLGLVDLFKIEDVKFTLKDGKRAKFGRGRVVDAQVALAMLRHEDKRTDGR